MENNTTAYKNDFISDSPVLMLIIGIFFLVYGITGIKNGEINIRLNYYQNKSFSRYGNPILFNLFVTMFCLTGAFFLGYGLYKFFM